MSDDGDPIIASAMLLGAQFDRRPGHSSKRSYWLAYEPGVVTTGYYILKVDAAAKFLAIKGFVRDFNGVLQKV